MRATSTALIFVLLFLAGCGGEVFQAAEDGDLALVDSLTKQNPKLVHSKNLFRATPLFRAALKGRVEVCALLI